jgi:hypothetical protein
MEQRWINGFLRHSVAGKSLAAIRPEDFAAYRDERLAEAVPSTVSRMLVIVSMRMRLRAGTGACQSRRTL